MCWNIHSSNMKYTSMYIAIREYSRTKHVAVQGKMCSSSAWNIQLSSFNEKLELHCSSKN